MSRDIKLLNAVIPLDFYPATVIHADKYSEVRGGAFNAPVTTDLYTDIVFRLEENNQDYHICIKNIDLPIYSNQPVTLISAGAVVVGYIDNQTNDYYYIIKDIASELGLGLPFYWVILIGLLCAVALYFYEGGVITIAFLLPFLLTCVLYVIQSWILNYRVKKAINQCLNS